MSSSSISITTNHTIIIHHYYSDPLGIGGTINGGDSINAGLVEITPILK
jgi:hypothetical protein